MWKISVLTLAAFACSRPAAPPVPQAAWRLDRSTFDTTADPCSDFYQYVCGGFATIEHVPADRGHAAWETDRANAANDRAVRELLGGTDRTADPELSRLRAFFGACMASDRDRTAEATLHAWLARVERIATRDDVLAMMRELHRVGIDAFFRYAADPDPTDRNRYRAEIDRGGLGPWRMYSDTGAAADERRDAYRAHIARTFQLAGSAPDQAAREADAVFELDRSLGAAIPLPRNDDPNASEHPMTIEQLAAHAPHIAWPAYVALVDHRAGRRINVVAPGYLAAVDTALAERPVATLKLYLRWQLLKALGPALPGPLGEEHYRFETLAGVNRASRTDECQLETLKVLGIELSHQFATRQLGAARDKARSVAESVRAEIVRALATESWLSPAARTATADKVRSLVMKIGFPDQWPATGSYPLGPDTFLDNFIAARSFEQQRSWQRVNRERRRDSWENIVYPSAASGMAAARLTIPNGFPDLLSNSIVFTAAMLQAPLFDGDAPPEVSYGGFGMVVGHELGHVIEMHGFDSLGELREIWTADDIQAHDARRACVIDDANRYVAFDQTHLDGKQTYSENVADLPAIRYAYAAFAREVGPRLTERGSDGFTRAQRFFVAYAQHWCQAERPAFSRENLRDDPHAPPRYRTNEPLANLAAFAQAFACRSDAPLAQGERCTVW
jgi:endothelin-converting enzyme/putative endopeptidase